MEPPPVGGSGHNPPTAPDQIPLAPTPPRGGKKVKMGNDDSAARVTPQDPPAPGSTPQSEPRRRKISFKEATMGTQEEHQMENPNQTFTFDPEELVSSDSEGEEEEDPFCPTIKLTKEEKIDMRRPWWSTLIVKVLNYKVSYQYLKRRLAQLWGIPPDFNLIELGYGFHLVKPSSEEEYEHILTGGPWMIADHYVTVRRYLTVQFVRFFWKRESNQKAKILRKVDYPLELDVYDLCSDDLKQKLVAPRKILRDEDGKKLGLKAKEKSSDSKDADVKMTDAEGSSDGIGELSKAITEGGTSSKESQLTGLYELVAVLTHQGRVADSGHYNAWVKQENGKWILFNDDKPIPKLEEDITKLSGGGDWHMAYICMYKARDVPM